jgi:hypothetical protein
MIKMRRKVSSEEGSILLAVLIVIVLLTAGLGTYLNALDSIGRVQE